MKVGRKETGLKCISMPTSDKWEFGRRKGGKEGAPAMGFEFPSAKREIFQPFFLDQEKFEPQIRTRSPANGIWPRPDLKLFFS